MKKEKMMKKVAEMLLNNELGDIEMADFSNINDDAKIEKVLKKMKKTAVGPTLNEVDDELWREYKSLRLLYERVKFSSLITKDEWNELIDYRKRYSFRDVTDILSTEEYRKMKGITTDREFFENFLHCDDIVFGNNKVALTTGRILPRW